MTTLRNGSVEPYSLREEDVQRARESSAAIADLVRGDGHRLVLRLEDPSTGRQVEAPVPAPVLRLLTQALQEMANGHCIALMPMDAELSTQQAADLLGVSRPYLVKLLEEGRIPFRRVGSQRRIRFEVLRRYMADYQHEAARAVGEMAAEAQQMGLYE